MTVDELLMPVLLLWPHRYVLRGSRFCSARAPDRSGSGATICIEGLRAIPGVPAWGPG